MKELKVATSCESDTQCRLCGDDAELGKVIHIETDTRIATVRFANYSASVALDLVDASVGDVLLVHLGFAIHNVDRP